ncbi:MAG: methionine synthase [Planctomycetes bacterium]|nr:methionine synthase [Planctomycetota bacterium]
MPSGFLKALQQRILVLDGAMGSTLQDLELTIEGDYLGHENCVDLLVRSRPELVESIHRSFLEAGSDAVETDTFGANKLVFSEFHDDLVGWTRDLNREAAEIARAACDAYQSADKPRFVLGSLGPGTKLISFGQVSWEKMHDSYREQAMGLVAGGADALLIETCQDLLQAKCAVDACLDALVEQRRSPEDVPILVSITIETTGTMLLGSDIVAAATALRPYPIAALGLNCATGPTEMRDHVAWLAKHWDRPISIVPNAGLPVLVEGHTSFPLRPDEFAETLTRFIDEFGVRIVGGCCGTTPDHIRRLVETLDDRSPGSIEAPAPIRGCTSLYSATEYEQELSFLIVGERLNASGSRKFKRLLEEENWDEMVSMARQQVREGANVLDLNVDYAGRDNAADMAQIVQRVVRQVDAPLMIDSTQLATIEAGLQHAPGKCIINSANFEDGDEKFDAIGRLASRYGAALVIGSIDEDVEAAMARTADRKLDIARRGLERATQVHGIAPADVLFDPLVLPISTGMAEDRRSAVELIEGTRRIAAAFPDSQIVCGLSNVSFGLKPAARVVLNSVFLHELLEAGLTSAIVHASKILPLAQIPAEQRAAALDLIHDRRAESVGGIGLPAGVTDEAFDPLHAFVALFPDGTGGDEARETRSAVTLEQRLRDHIVHGEKQDLREHLDEALERYGPLDIINDHLLDGMRVVGELFGSGQMQLPFVLQSAEVMKMAVAHLEPRMERVEGQSKGTIVLATVKGDVHDIGKNLVDIILTNNGYTVHNLGIKQTLGQMVEALEKTGADAVGMSGLLVKSVLVMEENLRELNGRGLKVPVLLGGAALTRHYAETHLRGVYEGPLYYGRDAFDGLRICEHLAEGDLGRLDVEIDERVRKRAALTRGGEAKREREKAGSDGEAGAGVAVAARSAVATDVDVPEPPFWGTREVAEVDLEAVFPYINKVALFRGQWGFRKGAMSDTDYARQLEEVVHPIFDRMKRSAIDEDILRARIVYGWFPCHSEGEDLVVFDPEAHEREIERFSFPRQGGSKRLCISDFFRPAETGRKDVVGFHCVTVGPEVSRRAKELFDGDEYTEYLYLHGLGVESAEALAELWHKRMRTELGIGADDAPEIRKLFTQGYRGSRYSFGYPACPEMSDQEKLFRLLDPSRIGCTLTENWQIEPEQSTSAIIVHHPEAKYFNV